MVDKTITPPTVLDPPFKEPVVDSGQIMTQLWQAWCTGVSQQPTLLTGGAVMMRSGTSRSDPLGAVAVAIVPPFTASTLSFQVNAAPTEPTACMCREGPRRCRWISSPGCWVRTTAAAAFSRCRIPTSPGSPRGFDAVDMEMPPG